MRLFEFVPCGGWRGGLLHDDDDDDDAVTTAAPRRRTEETSPLPCATSDENRRRRSAARTTGSWAWRPSLGAISEDGKAVTMNSHRSTARQAAKTAARPKRVASDAVRTQGRSEREDLRHFSVPAFAPTAFLF